MRAPKHDYNSDSFWYIYNAEHDWEELTRSTVFLDMTVPNLAAKVTALHVCCSNTSCPEHPWEALCHSSDASCTMMISHCIS